MIEIKIKLLSDCSIMPTRATNASVGYDLYSSERVAIKKNEKALIHTEIAMKIPQGYGGFIFSRSGLSFTSGIVLCNGVGVIDSDFVGEIRIPLLNIGAQDYIIQKGDRIAQIVILKHETIDFTTEDSLTQQGRDNFGFGSTGK